MPKLSAKSVKELHGVHESLVAVVKRAAEISEQDFAVHDGARTIAEQKEFVAKGVSKTMKSRHLVQSDGLGHAVDLVPVINGQLRWEWPPIYKIAEAMRAASDEMGLKLTWGGVWDKRLGSYGSGAKAMEAAVAEYQKRHPGPDFIDGPHFEMAK